MERRAVVDRRQKERRKGYDLELISRLGVERRKSERRFNPEKRDDWQRVTKWSSVKVYDVAPQELELES